MPIIRAFFLVMASSLVLSSSAQGGIRLILWDQEPIITDVRIEQHVGLGYDHDVHDRMSYGIDLRYGLAYSTWVATYRSAYHFSDASSTSLYMGPQVGIRSVGRDDKKILIPLGLRMGLRGGLERWYGDLYAGVLYNIGGGSRINMDESPVPGQLRSLTYLIGLNFGFGWDRK